MNNWSRNPKNIPKDQSFRDVITRALGISYIAKLILEAIKTDISNENELLKLLPKLNCNNPNIAEPSQHEKNRDQIFELEIAALIMASRIKTIIKDPPDIIAEYKGEKWGTACKFIYAKNVKNIYNRISEGVDQISKVDCEHSLVTLGITNIFERDVIFLY